MNFAVFNIKPHKKTVFLVYGSAYYEKSNFSFLFEKQFKDFAFVKNSYFISKYFPL